MDVPHARQRHAAAALLLLAGLLAAAPAAAQERDLVPVTIDGTTVKLATLTYKPAGDGPFPTLIFHHGSTGGRGNDPALAARSYEPKGLAEWFVARGWAVIAPSRRGRGGSEGSYEEGYACEEASALAGADRALRDIEAMTPVLLARPFVDRGRIAVGGQSRGGILSVAWSGSIPRCAVVNFVGGWTDAVCSHAITINQSLLNRGVAWGQPSLWLYGDGDLYYTLPHTRAYFAAFQAAGGRGTFHEYAPPDGLNGHFISRVPALWSATMEAYLAERGLPAKPTD